jgi:hypothetical protein
VGSAARDMARRSAPTRLAWALCLLSVTLALAAGTWPLRGPALATSGGR